MKENFITMIDIIESRNLKNFTIVLSTDCRKHLILTGKNGSGKTSLLLDLYQFLSKIDNGDWRKIEHKNNMLKQYEQTLKSPNLTRMDRFTYEKNLNDTKKWLNSFGGTRIIFSNSEHIITEKNQNGDFLLAYFGSKRQTNLIEPKGINKINLKSKYSLHEKANENFIQYIVNLKADRSFARDDDDAQNVYEIDIWFERFQKRLQEIFEAETLELKFDRKSYNFEILIDGFKPFNFNTLSDGYSSIISIVTELILRMESHKVKSYDLEGVVLIDEIETHLHVELQKKVLPFLIDFFPKIQFIVSTHSPFVLNSIDNAVIFDLERKEVTNDLSGYSYDTLIESYFNTNKYSAELIRKMNEFEKLVDKKEKTQEEVLNYAQLKAYLDGIPKFLSDELVVKLQQLKLKSYKGNN